MQAKLLGAKLPPAWAAVVIKCPWAALELANWGRRKESDMWDRVGRKDDGAGPRGTGKREQVKDQEEREDEGEERARVVAQENCQGSQ